MYLYTHKGRNIVVARDEIPTEGVAQVAWVALDPNLSGKSKRGRRANYSLGVKVEELKPFDQTQASELMLEMATAALGKMN